MVSGFGYTAFVIDASAGLIPGWECSLSKETTFVERALRHAAAFRARQGHPFDDAIHHSDAGSQGSTPRASARGSPAGTTWSAQLAAQRCAGTTLRPNHSGPHRESSFYDRYLRPTRAAAKLAVGD